MLDQSSKAVERIAKGRRRAAATLGIGLAFCLGGMPAAQAQPASSLMPVTFIAPYPPGGTVDALARAFAHAYSQETGRSFVVENRPGAGGNIGLATLARAAPDGNTIAIVSANMLTTNRWLYASLPVDPDKDVAPVAFIGRVPFVLVINNSIPANTLPELIALMKSKTQQFNFGSSGIGNTAHLFGELFKSRAGVEMVHVPYKSSGQTLQEVMAGRLQLVFSTPTELMPLLARDAVRPIAVASDERLAALPELPTLKELGLPGFETPTWFGIIAPGGTPPEIVDEYNSLTRKIMQRPDVRQRLEQIGASGQAMTPDEFRSFIADESSKWKEIVEQSGARLE
ncbi:Bug family tripartite tricarboxylate transporter substrate binding protein [Verticiella sediminum]|nr:tripartite tricarboxylate transporter substrate binding protein [Verticiella sediminum]